MGRNHNFIKMALGLVLLSLVFVACQNTTKGETAGIGNDTGRLVLPELTAVSLAGTKLRVVATTSIIGDVVAQVGGEAIELTVLMGAGQDPHSYEPGAKDLTAVADAHVIFINGWDLEEGLLNNLVNVAEAAVIVPVSAGITPREFAGDGSNHHADPHVWLDPQNVQQWVLNIEQVLVALDPTNSAIYAANAAAYEQELAALMLEMDGVMRGLNGRNLVTNHDALGYLAARYDLNIIGTVLPGASTLAEPSASDLTALATRMQAAHSCTIFAESIANTQLADAVGAELDSCNEVQILSLYTDAIGSAGSGADSYLGMMRANIQTLAKGLP
jgi:ABC-type Zn uptake system ZnuABC Zn-binding protein ZnuA